MKNNPKFILALLGLVAFVSCQNPVANQSAAPHGRVTVSVGLGNRSIVADVVSQVTSYTVALSNSAGDKFDATIDATTASSTSFDAVATGLWDVSVVAKAGTSIVGMGSLSQQSVATGADVKLSVALVTSQTGKGQFSLALDWPVSRADYVSATLEKLDGTAVGALLEPTVATSGSRVSATLARSGVNSGAYRLVIVFKNGGSTGSVAKTTIEAVNIFDNLNSNFWIDRAGNLATKRILGTDEFGDSILAATQANAGVSADAVRFLNSATDSDGNHYTIAVNSDATDSLDLGNNVILPSGVVTALVKYDSSGVAQWASPFVEGSDGMAVSDVVVDSSGNVFLCGWFTGTYGLVLQNSAYSPTVTIPNTAGPYSVGFVAKFDSSGTPLWAKFPDCSSPTSPYANNPDAYSSYNGLAVTGSGAAERVVVAGEIDSSDFYTFHNSANPDKTVVLKGVASTNPVLVSYDAAGDAHWASTMDKINGSTSATHPYCFLHGVDADAAGNLYVIGVLEYAPNGTTFELVDQLGGHPVVVTAKGVKADNVTSRDDQPFVAKYSPAGVPLWAKSTTGTSSLDYSIGPGAIAADPTGNLAIAISVGANSTTTFGTDMSVTAGPISSGIVVGYDTNGTALWCKSALTASMTAKSIAADSNGNYFVAGVTIAANSSGVDLGDGVIVKPLATTKAATLIEYSQWGRTVEAHVPSHSSIHASAFNAVSVNGAMVDVAGDFANGQTVDFGNSTIVPNVDAGLIHPMVFQFMVPPI